MGDTWTPREGAYGRTRDGQRVGPIERILRNARYHDAWKWRAHGINFWDEKGRTWDEGDAPSPNDLVAEWAEEGPVRTVTRREIVPGTYGRLGVGIVQGDTVSVGFLGCHTSAYPRLTADELDAAARVLTELAGALRG